MTKGTSHDEVIVSASAIPVADANGEPLTRIRVLPLGVIELKDGRGPYGIASLAAAQNVIAAAKRYWGAEDLPFDYDHQTLSAKNGKGGTAPASAWTATSNLTAEADGIYANDIEWTKAAAARIRAKEYRYFSPLFGASKTGVVTNLYGGGLTNDPAIGGLTAIAASSFHPSHIQEPDMSLALIAAVYGLAATATDAEVLTAASAQNSQLADLRKTLGVKDDDAHEVVIAAATSLKTAKTAGADEVIVPASTWTEMQKRVGDLEVDRVAAAVDRGITEGKIVPATKASMTKWAQRDLEGFNEYLESAPVIVAATAKTTKGDADAKSDTELSEDETKAARSAGLTDEEFIAARSNEKVIA